MQMKLKEANVQFIARGDFLRAIDQWRKQQDDLPSRPVAVQQLVEQALRVERVVPQRVRASAHREEEPRAA